MQKTSTIHTATRLRSTGANREQTLDSLHASGVDLAEADKIVDDIDVKLGLDGRTLPEDISRAARRRVDENRHATVADAPAGASAVRPHYESAVPAPAANVSARNAVPTLAELATGTWPSDRPRFVSPHTAVADAGPTSKKVELTPAEKSTLKTEANRRARVLHTGPQRLTDWLVSEGLTPQEARAAATVASERAAMHSTQTTASSRGDQTMAWLEICAGVALLIGGLAAGWFVGLFVFIIIDGFRRLGSS